MNELSPYKIMTMKSLINAAKSIMDEEGIDGITIRKVGDRAGLNSATIYNYFENLEHLKIFACLFVFDEYIDDIKHYLNEKNDPIENYIGIWSCFIKHTAENMEAYYTIFFNSLEREISEYVEDYYRLFPFENKNYGKYIDKMLSSSALQKRNIILLEEISKLGKIRKEDVDWINNMSVYSYESILYRMYRSSIEPEEGKERMMYCVDRILKDYMIK